ncbi:hypothetical protein [Mucilaginibacter sp.]
MKRIIVLLVILLIGLRANATQINKDSVQFIEFVHTGITTKTINPLFISTQKLDLHLNQRQTSDLKQILAYSKKKLTPQIERKYLSGIYDTIVTDQSTFSAIRRFIMDNKSLYTNKTHINDDPSTESYNIHLNKTETFSIYYKFKDKFFNNLKAFIIRGHYDKRVEKALLNR